MIIITPFAAFDPYNEVEAASLRTERLSTSAELMVLMSPVNGTPSTMYNGVLDPLIELNPLIRMAGAEPG